MSAPTPIAPSPDPVLAPEPGTGAPPAPEIPAVDGPETVVAYLDDPGETMTSATLEPPDDVPPALAIILGGVGRLFIAVGLLLLLFAIFQLWGTGLAESRAQDDLTKRFADRLAAQSSDIAPDADSVPDVRFTAGPVFDFDPTLIEAPTDEPSATEQPVTGVAQNETPETPPNLDTGPTPELVSPEPGEPIGVIEIPAIGVEKTIVEGTTRDVLRSGPGHYRSTPLPGRTGNTAIAGHRTTHGAPFFDLDLLQPGDEITVETLEGTATYLVEAHDDGAGTQVGHLIVDPSEVGVIADQGDNRLTLTACHPKYSAKERIIVTATLISDPSTPIATQAPIVTQTPIVAAPVVAAPVDEFSPERNAAVSDPTAGFGTTADATVAASLGWQREFLPKTLLWAAITALVAAAGWVVGRFWRRWPAYAMAVPPFSLALFYCFSNLEKFIPAV